jgi:hypothetical protein
MVFRARAATWPTAEEIEPLSVALLHHLARQDLNFVQSDLICELLIEYRRYQAMPRRAAIAIFVMQVPRAPIIDRGCRCCRVGLAVRQLGRGRDGKYTCACCSRGREKAGVREDGRIRGIHRSRNSSYVPETSSPGKTRRFCQSSTPSINVRNATA